MTTTVRISQATRTRVAALADKRRVTMAAVIDDAIDQYEDRMFWSDVNAAFERLDSAELASYTAEHESLDGTLMDGLANDDEDWSNLL